MDRKPDMIRSYELARFHKPGKKFCEYVCGMYEKIQVLNEKNENMPDTQEKERTKLTILRR